MRFSTLAPLAFAIAGLATPGVAGVSLSVDVDLEDATTQTLTYDCGEGDPLTVHYVNSDTQSLALVPVDEDYRVFVNVVSGSGARYVSGQHEWWTKGDDATLSDTLEDKTLSECAASSQ